MITPEDVAIEPYLIAFGVTPGYNIATAQGSTATPKTTWFQYGTATGVYTVSLPPQHGVRVYASDGTLSWLYSWTITNVQQQANTTYYGKFFYSDGTSSSEVTWVQPGLNANPNDLINVKNRAIMEYARIADICSRAAMRGWIPDSEWVGLKRAVSLISVHNNAKFNDGR